MNTHNLAIVFGPTLFQTDGKDYKAGRVVEDLISHYVEIFNVGSPLGPSVRTFLGNGEVEGRGSQVCSVLDVCRHLALERRVGGLCIFKPWKPEAWSQNGLVSPDGFSSLVGQ